MLHTPADWQNYIFAPKHPTCSMLPPHLTLRTARRLIGEFQLFASSRSHCRA